MGKLRTVSKILGGFFFTIFLTLVILSIAMNNFTNYNTLKPTVTNLFKQQFNATAEQINETYIVLSYECKSTGNEKISIQSLELRCSDILATSPERLPDLIAAVTFDKIYFKKYNCSFFQCMQLPDQDRFLFLISEQANGFFAKTIVYSGIATVLTTAIFIIATETWPGRFKAVGISLIFVGVTYFLIPLMKSFATSKLPQESLAQINPIINQILGSISNNLLIVLIVGIVLTAIGIILGRLSKNKEIKK